MQFFSLFVSFALIFALLELPGRLLAGWSEIDRKLYDDDDNTDTGVAIDAIFEPVNGTTPKPHTVILRHRRHLSGKEEIIIF